MDIILGKTAGFCYGVERAVNGAKEELRNNKDISCLGEIVHNKQVVKSLEQNGMKFVDDIRESKQKVIIRAHGVVKEIYEYAEKNAIELKDYTCPFVIKIHKLAQKYANQGYYIFLCGNAKHPENIGTMSRCRNNFSIIENVDDVFNVLEKYRDSDIKNLLVISQTTYSLEKFKKIEKIIKENIKEREEINLVINNTICNATQVRQEETKEISKMVNYMIIVGGKNSSNTRKLYEISKENCENTISVETKDDVDEEEILKYEKIGIMAGASTPKDVIEDIYELLNSL